MSLKVKILTKDNVKVKIATSKVLTGYTCSELNAELTDTQKQCVYEGLTPFEAESEAWFARMINAGTTPTLAQKVIYDQLFKDLKDSGNLAKIDCLKIYQQPVQTIANLNLISTSFTTVPINSPAWAAATGYTGASGTYLDSNFNPSTDAVQMLLDSAFVGIYAGSKTTTNAYILGATDATASIQFQLKSAFNLTNGNLNDTSSLFSVADSSDWVSWRRNVTDKMRLYFDSEDKTGQTTSNSTNLVNNNIYELARNNMGSPGDYTPDILKATVYGSDIDNCSMYNAIKRFLDTI